MTIEDAVVIKTGYTIGSGYNEIYLKTTDNEINKLSVSKDSNNNYYISITNITDDLKERIRINKEDINKCELKLKNIEKGIIC